MENKHTPEPWNYDEDDTDTYVRQGGLILAKMRRDYTPIANAARIVECINALAGIDNPKEWVDLMKAHKDITGFQTPTELAAYEKGINDEEKVLFKFIGDWQPNETNSVLGQLLADKVNKLVEGNEKLKYEIEEYKASESLHKSSSHMIRVQATEINQLKDKAKFSEEVIRVLKAELKEAKAEAWDECNKVINEYIWNPDITKEPTNPYKEEK